MASKVFACVAAALLVCAAASWRDPDGHVSLEVFGNFSGPLRVGEAVAMSCRSHDLPSYTTLTWSRSEGALLIDAWRRGPSNLTLALTVTPDLNGVQFFCFATFSELKPDKRWQQYSVYTPRVTLQVDGAPEPNFIDNVGRIEMSSESASTSHRVGDVVQFTCRTYDTRAPVLRVVQVKGLYEIQLHTGWQPLRRVALTLTAADHGTHLYCAISVYDADTNDVHGYVSNSIPIYIEN